MSSVGGLSPAVTVSYVGQGDPEARAQRAGERMLRVPRRGGTTRPLLGRLRPRLPPRVRRPPTRKGETA